MMRCAAIAVLLLSTAQVCVGGKFSKFTTCEDCVAAGYGWSASKGKCGGYSTKTCAAAAITEPAAGEGHRHRFKTRHSCVRAQDPRSAHKMHVVAANCTFPQARQG